MVVEKQFRSKDTLYGGNMRELVTLFLLILLEVRNDLFDTLFFEPCGAAIGEFNLQPILS